MVPESNKERVREAEAFVFELYRERRKRKQGEASASQDGVGNGVGLEEDGIIVPDEYQTAYDMRTWTDFPDRRSRT